MTDKRKRGQNFTLDEKKHLVKLLMGHTKTILNKKTDGSTNEAKTSAWNDIVALFNASNSNYRSKESLMKLWEKMKSEAKIYYNRSKQDTLQIEGESSVMKVDRLLEQVCFLLGGGYSSVADVKDCDPSFFILEENQQVIYPEDVEITVDRIDAESISNNEVADETLGTQSQTNIKPIQSTTIRTPIWSRRRPMSSRSNERSTEINQLGSTYSNVSEKEKNSEDMKCQLYQLELEKKKTLYDLQIESASKDLQLKDKDLIIKDLDIRIKKALLAQIEGQYQSNTEYYNC
ncbi:uncharacterized protein LOC123322018 [Coccinella septempunctata]|uniref:uncharacterized protein LOC123322018 n=1 Tax=Coccinella septempunctata TaxID=41139 RepID=UPI001D0973A5|nr:uncharacterized protein LOC123322018 [Coccinella septempunctata]